MRRHPFADDGRRACALDDVLVLQAAVRGDRRENSPWCGDPQRPLQGRDRTNTAAERRCRDDARIGAGVSLRDEETIDHAIAIEIDRRGGGRSIGLGKRCKRGKPAERCGGHGAQDSSVDFRHATTAAARRDDDVLDIVVVIEAGRHRHPALQTGGHRRDRHHDARGCGDVVGLHGGWHPGPAADDDLDTPVGDDRVHQPACRKGAEFGDRHGGTAVVRAAKWCERTVGCVGDRVGRVHRQKDFHGAAATGHGRDDVLTAVGIDIAAGNFGAARIRRSERERAIGGQLSEHRRAHLFLEDTDLSHPSRAARGQNLWNVVSINIPHRHPHAPLEGRLEGDGLRADGAGFCVEQSHDRTAADAGTNGHAGGHHPPLLERLECQTLLSFGTAPSHRAVGSECHRRDSSRGDSPARPNGRAETGFG